MLKKLGHAFKDAQLTINRMENGIFLVSVDKSGKPNVMTTSWGFMGFQWDKPVFITPVRLERYSHDLIVNSGEFVISVQPESMDDDMLYCGTHSGRDVDKFKERNFVPVAIPDMKTPGIQGSLLHYACKVIHTASAMPHTSHTFFFGEIMAVYKEEK